ncbi:MAG: type VI secretion system-associated protein TagF [Desulfobulbaceae bacterium]|nr:type VI secretion system-associated protein TagF [Desulfobulbaceae bacterium]
MLGLGKREKSITNWQWDVSGKHPAARDFFVMGQRNLMSEAFAEWLRRGAERMVTTSKESLVRSCSWRFWAKTPRAGILACGVIRNSCDAVGRPFPLLVMGTGKLENWEENWELLPFACERLWSQMEQLASRNYDSFELFQEDVNLLRPPRGNWEEMNMEKIALDQESGSESGFELQSVMVGQNQATFIPFQAAGHSDFYVMISHAHSLLKRKINAVPNSLFMGGLIEYPGLALFERPLSGQDFERMWMPT